MEPLLPTSAAATKVAKVPRCSDSKLIVVSAVLLALGAVLITLFPSDLPTPYHSPSTSCSEGGLTVHPHIGLEVPHGDYAFSQQKGNSNKTGQVSYLSPDCLSRDPSWKWIDPLGGLFRATPLIDEGKNIYFSTIDGRVIKFNEHGVILWTYNSTFGALPVVPALLKGMLILSTELGFVAAVDQETGKEAWNTRINNATSGDTSGIMVVDESIVLGSGSDGISGNTQVVALTKDGLIKWRYTLNSKFRIYNFQASSPGDGTVVFMDSSGGVYRLSLSTGELIWESGIVERKSANIMTGTWFSTGACVVGPNDVVYCASNYDTDGIFHAYHLKDGKPLWRTSVGLNANTGPAVGYLAGSSELAVIGGIGTNPGLPVALKFGFLCFFSYLILALACSCMLANKWRKEIRQCNCILSTVWRVFVWMLMLLFLIVFLIEFCLGANIIAVALKDAPSWLFLNTPLTQKVVALNAADGSLRWSYEFEPFTRSAAAGDEERLFGRFANFGLTDFICLPDSFAQAVINGAGSVYLPHADGRLYTIKDSNSDGHISSDTEVSYYDFGDAFQAGVGLAPSLTAVVPCGGGLFVWKA